MKDIVGLIYFFGLLGLLGFGIYKFRRWHSRRGTDLKAWAESNGCVYDPKARNGLGEQFPDIRTLQRSSPTSDLPLCTNNQITGSRGRYQFIFFDFHFGKSDNTPEVPTRLIGISAIILKTPFPLKPLHISRRGSAYALEHLREARIGFESNEFNRTFQVYAPDKRWAYHVLHPRAMEHLLKNRGYMIEFGRGGALIWNGKSWRAREIDSSLKVLEQLLDSLPEYVEQMCMKTTPGGGAQ